MNVKNLSYCINAIVLTLLIFVGNSIAGDTLSDSLKNGKTNGLAKIWYQTNDMDGAGKDIFEKENSTFDAGLSVGYVSETYKGFGFGATFYGVDDLAAFGNYANNSNHGFDHHETTSWLGEAYISYNLGNTQAKYGRQNIHTPLVNSDNWALFTNNFEGLLITNSDIPSTEIVAAAIEEERWLKSDKFEDFMGDGLLMIGAVNKSIPNTAISAYYYNGDDMAETSAYYLEAKTNVADIDIAAQFMRIDPDMAGMDATNAFGGMVSAKIGEVKLSAAVSTVNDGSNNAVKLSDHGIKTPLYTATVTGDGDIAGGVDTDSFKISAGYKPLNDLDVTLNYGYYDRGDKYLPPAGADDCTSSSTELLFKYTGIKNLALNLFIMRADHNGVGAYKGLNVDDSLHMVRFIAEYAF